jgi:hypothetical protein
MPLARAQSKHSTVKVENTRPLGFPRVNWGPTLEMALLISILPIAFVKRGGIAADRNRLR